MALKVFEGFAGYGGGSFAFRKLMAQHPDYDFEVIGYSEIDKSASELFDLNHRQANGEPIHNFGDITTLDPNIIPDFYLLVGFPANHSLPLVCKWEKMIHIIAEHFFTIL